VPARLVGQEKKTGSIKIGKTADMVLVGDDPSARLADLRQTRLIMLDGKLMDADALRTAAGFSGRSAFPPMKLLVLTLALAATSAFAAAESEPEATPVLSEKIRDTSPDGKYALRITYDRALNETMLPRNTPPAGGIFSQTIDSMAIVSLPDKEIAYDLTDALEGGNEFTGLTFIWSADSKWCAFYFTYPRVGYTNVFHLRGEKFKRAHDRHALENMTPARWVRPGVLELGVEDSPGFTATFDGKGKFKLVKKKS